MLRMIKEKLVTSVFRTYKFYLVENFFSKICRNVVGSETRLITYRESVGDCELCMLLTRRVLCFGL